jgi:hypothetical protein
MQKKSKSAKIIQYNVILMFLSRMKMLNIYRVPQNSQNNSMGQCQLMLGYYE